MDEFDEQAKAFAGRIAAELDAGRLNFPVSMEVSLRVKRLADDPDTTLEQIAAVLRADPVLAAKTLKMANTVALNPYRARVDDVRDAVGRIGLSALRALALAVASEQLAGDHRSPNMRTVAHGLWRRSVDVAAWCFALARETRAANPEAALLAGMMVHVGPLFLIARASDYPAMESQIDRFAAFVDAYQYKVGVAVLEVFDVPESILDSVDGAPAYDGEWPPRDLRQVVRLAELVSELPNPVDGLLGRVVPRGPAAAAGLGLETAAVLQLLEASHAEREEILAAVRG
ncbi:HDOD domain-containing protein [Pseudothauera nasutitermitis]|uniref:HDOD domain-containing protein n=1 Tax=Pseudothauera nasutitermitis TaxID=2565930 RepID=A0A4S4B1A5_9RHOO|nr:HDOD domain-containing protein [Pseudothauera nasutitermitis]THF66304.1 HDOD domain-containing protein [Pseudothauera nasutitermitis]